MRSQERLHARGSGPRRRVKRVEDLPRIRLWADSDVLGETSPTAWIAIRANHSLSNCCASVAMVGVTRPRSSDVCASFCPHRAEHVRPAGRESLVHARCLIGLRFM